MLIWDQSASDITAENMLNALIIKKYIIIIIIDS